MFSRNAALQAIASAATALTFTTAAQAALVDNLVFHSPFDGMTAPNVPDTATTEGAQNGTIQGAVTVEAQPGDGLSLGDRLVFPGSGTPFPKVTFGDVHDPGAGDLTVATWFRLGSTGTQFLISKSVSNASNLPGYQMWVGTVSGVTELRVRFAANEDPDGGGANTQDNRAGQRVGGLAVDTWYHGVMVIEHGDDDMLRVRGYLNGSNTGWVAGANGPTLDTIPDFDVANDLTIDATQPMQFSGTAIDSLPFTGRLDDVAIWNRALSPEEINQVYQAGLLGLNVQQIPEPTGALGMLGLGGALAARRGTRARV